MTALSIIEYLVTSHVTPMGDELALACPEKTFDTGIVSTAPLAAHADRDAMRDGRHATGRADSFRNRPAFALISSV